jgi:hypothetical protein
MMQVPLRNGLPAGRVGAGKTVFLLLALTAATVTAAEEPSMTSPFQLAAYYFPNYHQDPRNAQWHGAGWTEWELVKAARPRFEGHVQPKIPAWGYEDESDPNVMGRKINAAADHGLSAFIFDWYWYEDGPYLQRALEEGFLKAPNASRLKFALMWANHDWLDIQPATRSRPYHVLAEGDVPAETFRKASDHILKTYFRHPSYWRVDGGLYFSIYEVMSLIRGLGGVENTRSELDSFRRRVREAGLGEIHLNAVVWGNQILPGEEKPTDVNELMNRLGFNSITSYVWVHHQLLPSFPKTSYSQIRDASIHDWERFTSEYALPYFPNVTMGWDPSPRTIQTDVYDNLGYPFTPILDGNTPEAWKAALIEAKKFLEKGKTEPKILTLNAWNEWTEGSYLEPDTLHGMAYLEAIRDVFAK